MSEKLAEVFESYDMTVYKVMRGRESNVLKTDKGVRQLRKLTVGESRLNTEWRFKDALCCAGFDSIDRCILNESGELIAYDRYNNPYVMREYVEGQEVNLTNQDEVDLAVQNLAKLHIKGQEIFRNTEQDVHVRHVCSFKKRNQELKRVYAFIMRQHQKKSFEELYLNSFKYFYGQAENCEKNFDVGIMEDIKPHIGYCHGMYNQHSILVYDDNEETKIFTTSFDKFHVGNQLADLYHFLRKAVEKNNYSFQVAVRILKTYSDICPLSNRDIEYIYILYAYPEKFYKVSNQYINTAKNWISPKMLEKLCKIIDDEEKKQKILMQLKNINTSHFEKYLV